jgi:hypothetical protein
MLFISPLQSIAPAFWTSELNELRFEGGLLALGGKTTLLKRKLMYHYRLLSV